MQQLAGLRQFVTESMSLWKVPGLAVAVVKDGEVVLAEGYGYRNVAERAEVTADTAFAIGSSTKAFTTTIIASLVEEGKLDWDKPVIDYLPEFRLQDELATSRSTLRDLACHRTGLPRYDLVLFNTDISRETMVKSLRHLTPTKDFRSAWQYQNWMYATLGYIAERVTGQTWEQPVQERLFRPLGMCYSNFTLEDMRALPNHALPYRQQEDEIISADWLPIIGAGPAGSINSSVREMVGWLNLNLNKGKVGETQVISPASLSQLHAPILTAAPAGKYKERSHTSYGLGWFVTSYRGHNIVHHGGNTSGFTALVSLLPTENMGVVVLANMNGTPLPSIIAYNIYDRLLGLEPIDWSGRTWDEVQEAKEAAKKKEAPTPKTDTSPSHDLAAYAGEYAHAALGSLTISFEEGKLSGQYGLLNLEFTHHHYNTFDATLNLLGDSIKMLASFHLSSSGDVSSLSIPLGLDTNLKDLVFARVPDKSDDLVLHQPNGAFKATRA